VRLAIANALDRGQVGSPRELENLQHEIGSLARRQSDLEDVVLDIMERRESREARTVSCGSGPNSGRPSWRPPSPAVMSKLL
jgi:hypothetical protein